METAAVATAFASMHSTLYALTTLALTDYLFPTPATVANGSIYDYIVIGGGLTGNIMANRLTENSKNSVLVIEAGGNPPLESFFPGLFLYQPNTYQDWNFTTVNDGYTGQHCKNKVTAITQGHMLGGSSSLDHTIYVQGSPEDFTSWAEAAGDSSWNWEGMMPYFKKCENIQDSAIMNSTNAQYHGTNGYIKLTRESQSVILPYLAAYEELGIPTILDVNAKSALGYAEPLYTISDFRQSSAITYLSSAKDRSNLKVLTNTLVTKIIFDGTVAVGVEAMMASGETITIQASKEVILTAGAINSPKLLMLSGVGPKDHLESMGITVLSDLPVGQNLQDHLSVPLLYKMEASDAAAQSADPSKFPVPCFTGYAVLNSSQSYPDYQAIGLVFPHDSTAIIGFCSSVFSYKDDICQTMYEASAGRNILYTVFDGLHMKSRGKVLLNSTDPRDAPLIYSGYLTDESDLDNMVKFIEHFHKVSETTYFKSVNAEFVDLKLTECLDYELGTNEYWRCFVVATANTMFHPSSTCSLGSVVDAKCRVNGVSGLRVADASVMPTTIRGNIRAPINALAEKCADIIKLEYDVAA